MSNAQVLILGAALILAAIVLSEARSAPQPGLQATYAISSGGERMAWRVNQATGETSFCVADRQALAVPTSSSLTVFPENLVVCVPGVEYRR